MPNPVLPSRFLSQGWVALASLLCGTGVWLVVQLTERASITLEVPVQTAETLDSRIAVNLLRDKVPVSLSFPATETTKMTTENFRVKIAFEDLLKRLTERENFKDEGEVRVTGSMVKFIREENSTLESLNISVTDIPEPEVAWEARLRTFSAIVEPVVEGNPPPGYTYDPADTVIEEDREIRVMITRGLEARLSREGTETITILTEPLNIEGQRGPVRQEVALVLPEGVSLLPNQSLATRTIALVIEEQLVTRTVKDVPISYELLTAPDTLRAVVQPDTVDVTVEGRLSAMNKLEPAMINFGMEYVVERAGEKREIAIEPRLSEPQYSEQYRILDVSPRSVTVTIESTAPPEPTPSPTVRRTPTPAPTPPPTPVPTAVPTKAPTVAVQDKPTT